MAFSSSNPVSRIQSPTPVFPIPRSVEIIPEMKETKTYFLFTFRLADLKQEWLRVEVKSEKTLVISEPIRGLYQTFPLPKRVQSKKTKGFYQNGVLQILLPKQVAPTQYFYLH